MNRIHLGEDVKPLSEFRSNAATLIDQVRETRRPLLITQRGHGTAVVLSVQDYEALLEKIDLLLDIQKAEHEIDGGGGINHTDAKAALLARLGHE
ncbi:MAG: type II toxin-antitoxin system Phd/YefM family antitoxin [Bacteroidota bacterium]